MSSYEFLYSASYIIFNLAHVLIAVASIVIFSKKRTLSTTLMLIGSSLGFVLGVSGVLITTV
ncbi:MAG: hypothetical protein AAF901_08845, partial [Bacteroidota bacterium]